MYLKVQIYFKVHTTSWLQVGLQRQHTYKQLQCIVSLTSNGTIQTFYFARSSQYITMINNNCNFQIAKSLFEIDMDY